MSIRIVSLYDILHSNVLDWGGLHWGGSSPIFIHHNDFETFTQALEEVVDGSRGYLEPLEFKAFGRDALGRPVPFGEKFLGMCRVNDDEYAYFIIEKRDGRWTPRDAFAVTNEDPQYAMDDTLESVFAWLTEDSGTQH